MTRFWELDAKTVWISLPGHDSERLPPAQYLRARFTVSGEVAHATLTTTARGVYEAYINGARVGDALLEPGWTDYDKRIHYRRFDVSVQTGDNVIAAVVAPGWYAGGVGFKDTYKVYGARAQFLAELDIQYTDGSHAIISTDAGWRGSTRGAIRQADLLQGEIYDARMDFVGWGSPGFDDSGWQPVQTHAHQFAALMENPAPPVRIIRELRPISADARPDGAVILDLGQNMVGHVRVSAGGAPGHTIRLRFAEVLTPDGDLYTANLRSAAQTDTLILDGAPITWRPRFTFHGFRYVEVIGMTADEALAGIVGEVVHSDTPFVGTFACSNAMVNQLQQNIEWGQRGNFLSVPTDCPQRDERMGWLADAQIFMRTATYNADVESFFVKWMDDVADAQFLNGAFPDVAPRVVVMTEGAPAWADAGIIVPWTLWQVYGSTNVIMHYYGTMARYMGFLEAANPGYLRAARMGNNYGDWLSIGDETSQQLVTRSVDGEDFVYSEPLPPANTPKDVLATAYWAYDARLMAEMAEAIGYNPTPFRETFERVKAAFNAAYVQPDGRIAGDTQTAYVLALHFDLLPEELRPLAAQRLVADIERRGGHLSTGFVGVGYLCPVLTRFGYVDVAYRLLLNDTYPSWGYSIRHGATTIWERWDGWTEDRGFQNPNMNSFNHYSLGSIGQWLYQTVAGIDNEAPGFTQVRIRPRPGGGLTWARGEYGSKRGKIASLWRIEGERFTLRVEIPPDTSASVWLPTTDSSSVIAPAGAAFSRMEDGAAVYTVGAGVYEFVCSLR
jgi:alpha-L-rhamnosidase